MTRRAVLGTPAAGGGLSLLHPFSTHAQANQAHLRVMETTDIHVHGWPYDHYADRAVDTLGLSRTAAHVAAILGEATNAILHDNGDFQQGNPMGEYIAHARGLKPGDMHPVIAAFNALGVEAATLGNHEFNYGLGFLETALAGAAIPVVLANVATAAGGTPRADTTFVAPYVILDRMHTDGAGKSHPIRIGVIGFVPPQIMNWDRKHLEGNVTARDIVLAAQAWVPQMREEGADVVIALSHSGIGAADWTEGMENACVPLAMVEGIDAILTGHQHLVFPGPAFQGLAGVDAATGTIHGKPATMDGFWGRIRASWT